MDRADHYRAADDLVWKVRRQLNGPDWRDEDIPSMALQVAAAQVHATLAAVGRDVEDRVQRDAREAAAAVARAEELRGVGPVVVEPPAYGTESRDGDRPGCNCWRPGVDPPREHPRGAPGCTYQPGPPERVVDRMCRCGGPVEQAAEGEAHRMGAPGCGYDVLGRLR